MTFTYWHEAFSGFLHSAGLVETLHGLERDLLLLNEDQEEQVQNNLSGFVAALTDSMNGIRPEVPKSLEERQAELIPVDNITGLPRQGSITEQISQFLAKSKEKNNASNREEFLHSLRSEEEAGSRAARTSARTLDRNTQIKYDIAKNEDGPLRRTMAVDGGAQGDDDHRSAGSHARIHSGTYARFAEIEDHLAVKYVPGPPKTFDDRLRFLEEHITNLEREYPPWAALHFNQPRRGWPPPPRPTPIIVPSHLTSTELPKEIPSQAPLYTPSPSTPAVFTGPGPSDPASRGVKRKGRGGSSLLRAVQEKMEVNRALKDLEDR